MALSIAELPERMNEPSLYRLVDRLEIGNLRESTIRAAGACPSARKRAFLDCRAAIR